MHGWFWEDHGVPKVATFLGQAAQATPSKGRFAVRQAGESFLRVPGYQVRLKGNKKTTNQCPPILTAGVCQLLPLRW